MAEVAAAQALEGQVYITDQQTAGRGQRGNQWEAAPGQNLTFSVVLHPTFLDVAHQFMLNVVAALAVADTVATALSPVPQGPPVRVKWPNDVYAGDQKIAGILIENSLAGPQIRASVVGIGLNINQTEFQFSQTRPTSLALLGGRHYHLPTALASLAEQLEAHYLQLRGGQLAALLAQYHARLYARHEPRRFTDGRTGQPFEGQVSHVLPSGQLAIATAQGLRFFHFKEVVF
ncbi:MAG: biotin--[acetyl-CoA-carboxylase] ligase [Bernardetiaceae bacterium]|jgi:BirA family biotin operon repressor/biotin-[acetyl-CoA-carboxylase] ligase|nr:biotin--[acetyl-CoA-carboxylase] ligase [Bernardetiaceae bacterium]